MKTTKGCGECDGSNNDNCTSCVSTSKYLDAGVCYSNGACPTGKCKKSFLLYFEIFLLIYNFF